MTWMESSLIDTHIFLYLFTCNLPVIKSAQMKTKIGANERKNRRKWNADRRKCKTPQYCPSGTNYNYLLSEAIILLLIIIGLVLGLSDPKVWDNQSLSFAWGKQENKKNIKRIWTKSQKNRTFTTKLAKELPKKTSVCMCLL